MQEEQTEVSENELIAQRREKLAQLRAAGQAYPNGFRRDNLATALHEAYGDKDNDELTSIDKHVVLAGRIVLRRIMGKASFVHIQDMSGRIQLYLRKTICLMDNMLILTLGI